MVKDSDMGFVGATYNPLTQTCYGETHYDIKIPNLPSDTFKGYTFDKFRTTLGNPNAMKRNIFETSFVFFSMPIYLKYDKSLIERISYFVSLNTAESASNNRGRGISRCRIRATNNTG